MTIKQTAGRDQLGEFTPEFAHFNDDVLFDENWNNNNVDLKARYIIIVVVLMASDTTDSSLKFHLQSVKANDASKEKAAVAITRVVFHAGWPKGWAIFNLVKEVWNEDQERHGTEE